MKVAVLYEHKAHRENLKESLEKAGHAVTLAFNSNDFIEAVYTNEADVYVIDVQSWYRGVSIYNYYDIPNKIKDVQCLFFNTPEGFTAVEKREALDSDIVVEGLNKDINEITSALM